MPNCNFCRQPLENVFLDLGHQPPSNSFLTKGQLDEPEVTYPLRAYTCNKCWLVQVPESKKAAEIFTESYPYFSSQSPANVAHAKEYVEMTCERFGYDKNSTKVAEIGSNDGYLLQHFEGKVFSRIGYEPSPGPASKAIQRGIPTTMDFFNSRSALAAVAIYGGLDLICSINTIAHQPNINDFVEGIRIALAPGGVTTHEFPWLLKTIEGMQFDQFYHEHYSYFSFSAICEIFQKHGLTVFDVDMLPEHGGSLRVYATHTENRNRWLHFNCLGRIGTVENRENEAGIHGLEFYQNFQPKVEKVRSDFMRFLYDKPKICAYGAPAKANTFLNFCKVTPDLLPFTVDISPHKQGMFLPGSHIPVLTEEDLVDYRPDYVLVLGWNLREEIMKQLSYIREWNGRFVIAIPELEVI